jgi:hypothetical protein
VRRKQDKAMPNRLLLVLAATMTAWSLQPALAQTTEMRLAPVAAQGSLTERLVGAWRLA